MYDCPSRTPNSVLGRSRPIFGSATFTTVESRNTIPDPRIAAMRVQRCSLVIAPAAPSTGRAPGQLVRRCAGVGQLARIDRDLEAVRQRRERADPLRVVVAARVIREVEVEP